MTKTKKRINYELIGLYMLTLLTLIIFIIFIISSTQINELKNSNTTEKKLVPCYDNYNNQMINETCYEIIIPHNLDIINKVSCLLFIFLSFVTLINYIAYWGFM